MKGREISFPDSVFMNQIALAQAAIKSRIVKPTPRKRTDRNFGSPI
jgi:hypothetical protein